MLLELLFALRGQRLAVGLQEWLALMEALARGLHESSLTGFYHLARSLLVHSEAHFDAFDLAFAQVFGGIEVDALALTDELQAWLADPARLAWLSPEERAALEALRLDQLRELLERRLREQQEAHRGGSRWIGTGGTSPFGAGGVHPTGVRIGETGGGRSAAQVAAQRRYRSYRNDLVLDLRQIQLALRKLRELRREGRRDELDLPASVDRTSRNAGELELCWRPPRRNQARVLLLMDVGGSMDPHAQVVSQLFSAASRSKHFRSFHAYYFHNCVYSSVFKDSWFREAIPLADLLARHRPGTKLVMVGDALMHPMELLTPDGSLDYWARHSTPGIEWLSLLARHYPRRVWLNPEPVRFWRHQTVAAIRQLFPMFPLTLEGLDDAVSSLVGGRRPRRALQLGEE